MLNKLDCFTQTTVGVIPIYFIKAEDFAAWLTQQTVLTQTWLAQHKFTAQPDKFCIVPDAAGAISQVVVGRGNAFFAGSLATILPMGIYQLAQWHEQDALAWGMGAYQFKRYKAPRLTPSQLSVQAGDAAFLSRQVAAIYLVRDLINTPTEDMGPAQLADAVQSLANSYHAEFSQIIGNDLLTHHYPSIHAVGRASTQAPRLLDLRWGAIDAPKITLVGKGVCFDTGGLDLKPPANMLLMKKDMAGAAHVLGLAQMIMAADLPIRLRVLIPAVENAVAGNAYRPGDIIKTRQGLTVEIGNTDAEGRVILADALTEAVRENPVLLIDIATLTGAARVALGADISAFFTEDDDLAHELQSLAKACDDPIWRLPLYKPYRKLLDSSTADINNVSASANGGAITAALFLQEFVSDTPWIHFDLMAWNPTHTPGHPEGGEAMAIRVLFAYLTKLFGK